MQYPRDGLQNHVKAPVERTMLDRTLTIRCSRCNNPIERHTICPECGYYRGKPVIAIEEGV